LAVGLAASPRGAVGVDGSAVVGPFAEGFEYSEVLMMLRPLVDSDVSASQARATPRNR
jgi:hypothetical protein